MNKNAIQFSAYDIRIEPDLERHRFSGQVEIKITTATPTTTVRLSSLELSVERCSVNLSDHRQVICSHHLDPSTEEICIELPEPLTGAFQLSIDYHGSINEKMIGFYRSHYSVDGKREPIAVTQFQESAARMMFPCQDHPEKKARFEIEVILPDDLSAVSNTRIQTIRRLDAGKQQIRFFPTPVMSTYLVFLGVGRFEYHVDTKDRRLGLITTPGQLTYGLFGLDFGRKALHYCEDYYAIKYPLDKLDLLAIPDFAYGAMENWGAITFRENLLLDFPESTSQAGRMRICEVIAHEIAHQWFGNLVTPKDWRYLWLNESFATYFGFGVVDHYHPKWRVWEQFIHSQTQSALARDSLIENFSIEIPSGEHVVINTSTAPLIYNKGGSILRQIEGFMGSDLFRKGIQIYLNAHAYHSAASHHLWEAFDSVSNLPVTELMQSWIEQAGHPVVEVRRQGRTLKFRQQRYTCLPHQEDQIWKIPINLALYSADGHCRQEKFLMDKRTAQLELKQADLSYKLNSGQTGFYRVKYADAKNQERLLQYVSQKKLGIEDRWGIQMDLFAQILCGNASMSDYLSMLSHYSDEDAYLPLVSIVDHLFLAYRILDSRWRASISAAGRSLIERILQRIGWEPAEGEPHTTALLRDHILWPGGVFGMKGAATFASNLFTMWQKGTAIHPDIQKSVLQLSASTGDQQTQSWLTARVGLSANEHERMNLLKALGCFRHWDHMEAALAFTLDEVPMRNRFIPIVAAAENPQAAPFLWNWYTQNVEKLERIHPLLYERVIAAMIPST